MDRQHRRDLKHDKFVDEIGTLSVKARQNQRLLLMLAIGVVAVAVIAYGISFYRANREDKAQDALAIAIETLDSPLIPATPQPGQPTPPNAKFHTEAERTAAAEKQFKDVESQYSGSDASDVAGLYLGRIAVGRGDYKTARTYLEKFVSSQPKNVLASSARYSLYQLRIENGEAAQVASELSQEVKKEETVLPKDALLVLLAHAYDAQGNPDKTKEAYRQITTEFPDSPYALEAQRRVGPA